MAARVLKKTCPNCGAPFSVEAGVNDSQCKYCGNVIHVEWTQKAPPPEKVQPLTLYVKPQASRTLLWVILGTSLFPVVPGVIFAMSQSGAGSAVQSLAAHVGVSAGPVTFPVTCGLNQKLEITGQTFSGAGTLITAEVNCKLVIKDSKLSGDIVVHAKNLGEITIENSTIEGKEAAIRVDMNSKIFGMKKTVIKGPEVAVLAELNTEMTLEDSRVEGGETAIQAGSNFVFRGNRAEVSGKDYALRAGSNPKVYGKELVMKADRAAIQAQYNLELELRGGSIQGKEIGIRADSNPKLTVRDKARIIAQGSGVDAESNLELSLEDAVIDGGYYGIKTGVNAKLDLDQGGTIRGGRVGVRADGNLKLKMRSALIESEEGVGICSTYNTEIEGRNSRITGTESMRLQRRPNVLELDATTLNGPPRYNAQTCTASRGGK